MNDLVTDPIGRRFPCQHACLQCGQPFLRQSLRDIYCSPACQHAWWIAHELRSTHDRSLPRKKRGQP